jgi:two-component system LytT family response regulator
MRRKIRALVVDDEPLSLRRLELALKKFPDVELVGTASDGMAALEAVHEHHPDLIFLDIRMPGFSGIELAARLDTGISPAIVFVSAFGNFAVDAFGVNAVDYLLKPLDEDRLRRAVDRVRNWMEDRTARQRLSELSDTVSDTGTDEGDARYSRHLWVAVRERIVRLRVEDISWVEAAGDYVVAHTSEHDYLMPDSLRALEGRLDPRLFLRVHRGRIVNRRSIVEILRSKFGKASLRLATGDIVSVGRTYRNQLQQIVAQEH